MVMDEVCVRITGAKVIPTWKGPYPLTKLAELAINMIFLWTLSLWDSTISLLIPTSD